jgi:glyoxylase-like metal-dependent hydrolase (beta-lactamase superfamily II)
MVGHGPTWPITLLAYRDSLLAAGYGTSLLISYGVGPSHRILVDCGGQKTGKILADRFGRIPSDELAADLLVLTHTDNDRIGGALALLEDERICLRFRDIWFNGSRHLRTPL